MASLVYLSCIEDEANGQIDFGSDTFGVMLVDSTYVPDSLAHRRRSDISGEVIGSVGYGSPGELVDVTVDRDDDARGIDVVLGGAEWPQSRITARAAIYYKSRGGAAADDELVAVNYFNSDRISDGGTFSLLPSTLRINT